MECLHQQNIIHIIRIAGQDAFAVPPNAVGDFTSALTPCAVCDYMTDVAVVPLSSNSALCRLAIADTDCSNQNERY